jgi:hypothetical protein
MTTPEGVMPAPAVTSETSVMDDIIEIFYAPSRVFARRRDNPRFWAAFFILSILFAIGIWVMMKNYGDVLDAQMRRQMDAQMAKNPQMTPEMAEKGRHMGQMIAPIGAVFAGLVSTLILGLGVWLVGKLFDSKADLRHGMMIATFASFPKILDLIIGAVLALTMGTAGMTNMMLAGPSLARFAPSTASATTIALLSRFSIGTIWATILIAIGLHVAGRMMKGRAYTAAIVLWLIGTGLAAFGAMRQG